MPAIRMQGRINKSTTLIDTGMYGVAGVTAVYLIDGGKKCLVDGGTLPSAKRVVRILREMDAFPPDMIVVTHSHYDHVQGIPILQREAAKAGRRIEVLASEKAIPLLEDQSWNEVLHSGPHEGIKNVTPLKENDIVDLGNITLRIYEVPGHSDDHIALMDETSGNIFIGDAIGDKIADRAFLPPFYPPFWNPVAFLATLNKLKQLDYDSMCLAHFGYIYGNDAKPILDEAHSSYDTWWELFNKYSNKLEDTTFMREAVLNEIKPGIPEIKIYSLKLKILFTLMNGLRKLTRKAHQPVGVLLLGGVLRDLAAGYRIYKDRNS